MNCRIKVLWFSINSVQYNSQGDQPISSGGWIESLLRVVSLHNDLELGIVFMTSDRNAKVKKMGDVTYFPIHIKLKWLEKLKYKYTNSSYDVAALKKYLAVIEEFKPNLIHAFGSEWNFGLLKSMVDIPIVIHMQGFWPEYRNSAFPPGWGVNDFYCKRWYNPKSILGHILAEHKSMERALREEKILSINNYYFGRTRWDKALVKLYNPKARYFFCSEALRNTFVFENKKWKYVKTKIISIVTTGAGHNLKGYDVVLKTAKLLTEHADFSFKWYLCGATIQDMKRFEQKVQIKCTAVNVIPLGLCTAEKIKDIQLNSTLYVHAAYIDNSPNAVCEAQYLGLPIISTNVGGIPSLFDDAYPQDMLVSTNDPYYLSSKIIELCKDNDTLKRMSQLNFEIAHKRHDDEAIYSSLMSAYVDILKFSK